MKKKFIILPLLAGAIFLSPMSYASDQMEINNEPVVSEIKDCNDKIWGRCMDTQNKIQYKCWKRLFGGVVCRADGFK